MKSFVGWVYSIEEMEVTERVVLLPADASAAGLTAANALEVVGFGEQRTSALQSQQRIGSLEGHTTQMMSRVTRRPRIV